MSIASGSPAEKAGLRPALPRSGFISSESILAADIVYKVNGKNINSEADFLQSIFAMKSGDLINITILRRPSSSSIGTEIDKNNDYREIIVQLKLA